MICMGAGTNHWFHSDETYRSFIALLLLGGCVGINGGGWAHYVGQEKIRTFAGWQTLAFALDWRRPPRQAQGTSWFYQHTEQWRYDRLRPERFASPLGRRPVRGADGDRRARQGGAHGLDAVVPAVRPQPAGARRRGRRRRRRPGRARRVRAQGGPPELRGRRPERAVELPARVLRLALEPARLLGQGTGVLPAPPAGRRPRRAAGRAAARRRAPVERALARGDPARQARPAGQRRLPHDDDRPVLRRRAAGGDLVREVRPVDDRHAPVRAFVQPGGAAAVGGAHRLGHVPHDRAQVLRAGRRAPRRAPRRRGHPGPARLRPARSRSRAARWPTGGRASASRCPGARCPT